MNIAELRAAVLRYQATSSLEHTMAEHQLRNLAAVALPALLAERDKLLAVLEKRPDVAALVTFHLGDIQALALAEKLVRGRLAAHIELRTFLRALAEAMKGEADADKG